MNKKKQPLELPTIVTYDRDELIMDNVEEPTIESYDREELVPETAFTGGPSK